MRMHHTVEALGELKSAQPHILYSAFMVVKFCTYSPATNFNIYLWNGVLLFEQPLNNHHTRLSQPCKVVNTLHKMPQPCKVVTRLQQSRNFHMCMYIIIIIYNNIL